MSSRITVFGLVLLTLGAARSSHATQCTESSVCARINGDVDVFVGKILTEPDDEGTVRVRVVRTFKGFAKGEISVDGFMTGPGVSDDEIGESYLFYTSTHSENGVTKRRLAGSCGGGASKMSDVSREDLNFLEGLGRGPQTGKVSGRVFHELDLDKPIPDLRVIVKGDGGRQYSATTDNEGIFRIADVLAGAYKLEFHGLSDDLLLEGDDVIQVSPHGCPGTMQIARHNATIGGRVALPLGVDVEDTAVHAFTLDGTEVGEAFADKDGRYVIVGIKPGDYVVGVNAGRFRPGPERPFPPTYAPSATDREHASPVHIETGTHLTDVDIWVNAASSLATIVVRAKFDDGTAVSEGGFSLSIGGLGQSGGAKIDSSGAATLRVVRGVRALLAGNGERWEGGTLSGQCLAPLELGPDEYPEHLDVTLSEDGCRQQSNLESLSSFRARHPDPFEPLLVRALHPNGTAGYRVEVLASDPDFHFSSGGFQTDTTGRIEVPAPLEGPVTLRAFVLPIFTPPAGPPHCASEDVAVVKARGKGWRYSADESTWHEASEPIVLRLKGPDCLHESRR